MDILRADERKRMWPDESISIEKPHDKHYFEISPWRGEWNPTLGGTVPHAVGENSGIFFGRRNCWAGLSDIAIPSPPAVISAEGDDDKKHASLP